MDETHSDPALTPRDPRAAREALEGEKYFDEEIGVTLRLWFYYHALPDRERALKFMLAGASWYGRPLLTLIYPKVRDAMMQAMDINAETAKQSN